MVFSQIFKSWNSNPVRITKADKEFAKKLDFKNVKFPVKVRDIHKIEKSNSIGISVFGYENKEKHLIYVLRKSCIEGNYVLIKNFNTFMYKHTFHHGKNIFVVILSKILMQKKY